MAYTPTTFANGAAPAINDAELNKIGKGIAQAHWFATTTNAGNAYSATLSPAPVSFAELTGVPVRLQINAASTAAVTININGLGAKNVKKPNGVAVANWTLNAIATLVYNGTDFILQGDGGSGNATAPDLLSGKTASTDAGDIVGTIPVIAADTAGGAVVGNPGRVFIRPPLNSYWNNTGFYTYWDDANFAAANWPTDKTIFGLAGTMPLRGSEEYAGWRRAELGPVAPSAGRSHMRIPSGAYIRENGSPQGAGYFAVFIDDANFIAANILNGKTIFGLAGTAKRQAIGTFTQATTQSTWSVAGLSFSPSKVIISIHNNGSNDLVIMSNASDLYDVSSATSTVKTTGALGVSSSVILGGSQGTMNADGFTCTRGAAAGALVSYWAYE